MSDTNINAFEAEVQEAEKQLAVAQNNLDEAKQRLADKRAELGIEEPVSESEDTETSDEELDEPVDQGVVGDADPIPTAPELPQAGDVVEPTTTNEQKAAEGTKIEVQHES